MNRFEGASTRESSVIFVVFDGNSLPTLNRRPAVDGRILFLAFSFRNRARSRDANLIFLT